MKVKFLETSVYEGKRYEVGAEEQVSSEVVKALGPSVRVLEKDKKGESETDKGDDKKPQ